MYKKSPNIHFIYSGNKEIYYSPCLITIYYCLSQTFKNKEKHFYIQCNPICERTSLFEGSQDSPVCPFGKKNM